MSAWHGYNAVTTYVAEGTKLYKRPSDAIKYSHQFESTPRKCIVLQGTQVTITQLIL
jgi:hypothetical protein